MKKQNKKKIIITVTAVVLVVAIGLGVWFGVSRGRSEPVKVFAFNSVGMTEYWGDSQESYGPVSTDKIQTVFLSSTQTVTEMKVAQGDTVKKGDVLMVLEAMKMENEISAPQDGTIASIDVRKGDTVNSGDVLYTMG